MGQAQSTITHIYQHGLNAPSAVVFVVSYVFLEVLSVSTATMRAEGFGRCDLKAKSI